MGFKILDGVFGYIAAMDIWRYNLEGAFPLVNYGATIIGASLIVEDLDINAVALGFEAIHDDVVGRNVIPAVSCSCLCDFC